MEQCEEILFVAPLASSSINGASMSAEKESMAENCIQKDYPRSGVSSSLHLLVTEFEIRYLRTLAFGGSVNLT